MTWGYDVVGKNESLPRVTFIKTKTGSELSVNFVRGDGDTPSAPDGLQSLWKTFQDWTEFCIASIEHMPMLSGFGHYMTGVTIESDVIGYLKEISISHEEVEDGDETRHSFIIHDEDVAIVAAKLSTTTHMLMAATSMQRSNLSALIAEFEYLCLKIARVGASVRPDILVPDGDAIPVGWLRSGGTFDEWYAEKVELEISKKLNGGHGEAVRWLLTDFAGVSDLSQVEKSPYFVEFQEICQRRHIFIHNGGVANKQYIKKCLEAGIKEDRIAKEGDQLTVDIGYLKSAAARVYLVGAFTISICMQNLYPRFKGVSYRSLLAASHDFLVAGMTKQASRIIEFAEVKRKDFDHDLRLKFGINKALSRLLDPDLSYEDQLAASEKILSEYDWSVTTPTFDLALACIRRKFDNILDLAKRAYESGLGYQDASSFCVFGEAREIAGFLDCFPKGKLMLESKKKD